MDGLELLDRWRSLAGAATGCHAPCVTHSVFAHPLRYTRFISARFEVFHDAKSPRGGGIRPVSITLHIGTHKTGTTTIQRFASKHRRKLRMRGTWYPGLDLVGAKKHYAHHAVSHALADVERGGMDREMAERWCAEVRRKSLEFDRVFISAEPMYRHTVGNVSETDASYWDGRRAYVERVAQHLGTEDVEVVVVVRRQDAFAQSLYNEHVKVTRYRESFEQFVDEKRPLLDYDRQLGVWSEFFDKVRAFVFADLIETPGLVSNFFDAVGIGIGNLPSVESQNESMPLPLVEFKRQMNGTRISLEQLHSLAEQLLDPDFVKRAKLKLPKLAWASPERLLELLTSFEEGNERVRRNYTSLSRVSLFPSSSMRDLPVFEGLEEQQWQRIVGTLLAQQLPQK